MTPETTEKILDRITKLLAQAESTTFPEEAATYTATAQSLMQRYAVEAADLEARTGQKTDKPVHVEIKLRRPYTGAKSVLLHAVTKTNRCRMVRSRDDVGVGTSDCYRRCTVFGMSRDVAYVELLYASLSVQCVSEMLRTPVPYYEGSKTFRKNFIYGYAARIKERLEEMNAAPENKPSSGAELVFVGNKAEIDSLVSVMFPFAGKSPSRITPSAAGREAGMSAANRANFNRGHLSSNRRELGR